MLPQIASTLLKDYFPMIRTLYSCWFLGLQCLYRKLEMGCMNSKEGVSLPSKQEESSSRLASPNRVGGNSSVSQQLTPNEAAAAAARDRFSKKGLNESSRKAELLGRIDAVYTQRNQSRPLGLGTQSVDELQLHLTKLKSGSSGNI